MLDSEGMVCTTPLDLIQRSVESGASVEHLEKLMEMQLRWEAAVAKKAFHKAMAAFKAACPPVLAKGKEVKYKDKGGNWVSYHHTTLGAAIIALTPYLSEFGLSATWETDQAGDRTVSVTAIVAHELGHSERTTLVGPLDSSGKKNSIQQLGSSVTYLQRYTLLAALGIATADQDDDAVAMNQQPIGPIDDAGKQQEQQAMQQAIIVDRTPPESTSIDNAGEQPVQSILITEYDKLDDAIASCSWSKAYTYCNTKGEVRAVGRAIAGTVEEGADRDCLLELHAAALRRCSDAADDS